MTQKTILLFSTEAGIAHVTRTLAVGGELKNRGHRVVFAIAKNWHHVVKRGGLEVVDAPVTLSDDSIFDSIKKWLDPVCIASFIREEQKIIKSVRPDCALVDFRPSAIVACQSLGVPMAFITGSGGLPYGCKLPPIGYPRVFHSFVGPILEKVVWYVKMPFYRSFLSAAESIGYKVTLEDFITRGIYIVPEIEGYLPGLRSDLPVHYVGPIFWKQFEAYQPEWLVLMKPNGRTVYISFGGTGYDSDKLMKLSEAFLASGFRVIVSSSNIARVDQFPKHKNLFVDQYISGFDASRVSDIVVCHGGYGTMMQAVLSGKPVVSIPYNVDQLLHGYRFQEMGLGRCLVRIPASKLIPFHWSRLFHLGKYINTREVLSAVKHILQNKSDYQKPIDTFVRQVRRTQGASAAADIVESL